MALTFAEVEAGTNHWQPDQTHPEILAIAKSMWWYSAPFSPKDVPKFYDVSGVTENPEVFQKVIDIFVQRYREMPEDKRPTHVVGYDARGFVLGPPIALALKVPFVLLRKAGKNPGVLVHSSGYHKEYVEQEPETQCVRVGAFREGSRVLLIDDLIATGGTAISGFELVEACGAQVCEFAAMTCLPFLDGAKKIREFQGGKFKHVPVFTLVTDAVIPDAACGDPKDWKEPSRVVDAKDAKAMLAKYHFPR